MYFLHIINFYVANIGLIITDTVPWDVERLAEKVKGIKVQQIGEESSSDILLSKYFESVQFGNIVHPAVILDLHGKIITWHLPGALTASRVVCVFHCFL